MFWILFSIYLIVLFIGLAINDRYAEDHFEYRRPDLDNPFVTSDYEFVIGIIILWPIAIPIIIISLLLYSIYYCFYYAVDKIYTKIISNRKSRNKTKQKKS